MPFGFGRTIEEARRHARGEGCPKIVMPDYEIGSLLDILSEPGRVRDLVACPKCKAQQWVYRWSWAGHGFFKCRGCGARIGFWETRSGHKRTEPLAIPEEVKP